MNGSEKVAINPELLFRCLTVGKDQFIVSLTDFIKVPEVDCCITSDRTSSSVVDDLRQQQTVRDNLHREWRELLMEVWHIAHQKSLPENSDELEDMRTRIVSLSTKIKNENKKLSDALKDWKKEPSGSKVCDFAGNFWICDPLKLKLACSTFLDEKIIKLGASEVKTFHEATVGYMEKHFNRLHGTYRVPSVFLLPEKYRTKTGPPKEATNNVLGWSSYFSEEQLKLQESIPSGAVQDIIDTRRGDRAVDVVVSKLMDCENRLPGGMFVISNLKYRDYLRKIQKPRGTSVTRQDGDHDIILIHRRIGVIFFQVKSFDAEASLKTQRGAIRTAIEQVIKDKFVFYESNRDLEFVHKGIPVYGFVALPNILTEDLAKLGICQKHRSNIVTGSDLNDMSTFLGNNTFVDAGPVFTEPQYKRLCGRYVGLLSEIKLRTLEEGADKVGKMVERIFLTPEQAMLIYDCEHKFMLISGDYGTGKSLVLAKKAQHLVEDDPHCIALLVSCADIDNYHICKLHKPYQSANQLKDFVSPVGQQKLRLKVLQFGGVLRSVIINLDTKEDMTVSQEVFCNTLLAYLSKINEGGKQKTHVFLDEVLFRLFKRNGKCWNRFTQTLPEGSYCWMCAGPHSFSINLTADHLPTGFLLHRLQLIMRVSQNVHKLTKAIERYMVKGVKDVDFFDTSVGHTFPGPKPLLVTLPKCGCDESKSLPCNCSEVRLAKTLKKVKEEFDFGEQLHSFHIIILFFHCQSFLLPLYKRFQIVMQKAFDSIGFELEWKTMYGLQVPWANRNPNCVHGRISVVDQHTFMGCETRNVMCVDMFGMHQWYELCNAEWFQLIVNRCTSQYIHINWPADDAKAQWKQFLEGYSCYCKSHIKLHDTKWYKTYKWFSLIVNLCNSQYIHINWPAPDARAQWLQFWEGYSFYCRTKFTIQRLSTLINSALNSRGQCVEDLRKQELFRELQLDE